MAAVTICSDFGNVPQCNKGHMTNTANIILDGEKLKAKELMLLNRGVGESPLDSKEIKLVNPKGNQP